MCRGRWLLALVLGALIALLYGKTVHYDYVNYDDPSVVVSNPRLEDPSFADVGSVFTEIRDDAYLPLYTLALMPEAALFGKKASAFHGASAIWHLVCALLVWAFFEALTKRRFPAIAAALVFAVHPVAAESVAWISGRKDQVSLTLLLVGLWVWLRYLEKPSAGRLTGASISFLLGCFAKGTVVVFPLLAAAATLYVASVRGEPLLRRAWKAHAFLFLLALLPVAVHVAVAASEGTAGVGATHTPLEGIDLFVQAANRYGFHLLAPFDLAVHYDLRPGQGSPLALATGGAFLTALFVGVLLLARGRFVRAGLALTWILVSLLPFNNVFPRTSVPMADRYLIVALPALGFLVGALIDRLSFWTKGLGLAGLVAALGLLCWVRVADFADSETLFRAAMRVETQDPLPPAQVAEALLSKMVGHPERTALRGEALVLFRRSVALAYEPVREIRARLRYGDTLLRSGDGDSATLALDEFQRVRDLVGADPARFRALGISLADIDYNRAQAHLAMGHPLDARRLLNEVFERTPGHRETRYTLAMLDLRDGFTALAEASQKTSDPIRSTLTGRARQQVERGFTGLQALLDALVLESPSDADADRARDLEVRARAELGQAYLRADWKAYHLVHAGRHAEDLIRGFPEHAAGYLLRARTREVLPNQELQILQDLEMARRFAPDDVDVLVRAARVSRKLGRQRAAVLLLRKALEIRGDSMAAKVELSSLYVAQANAHRQAEGPKNAELALRAAAEARSLDALNVEAHVIEGEILEGRGRWSEAARCYGRALEHAPNDSSARRGLARYHQALGLGTLAKLRQMVEAVPPAREGELSFETFTLRAEAEENLRDLVMTEFRRALELAPGAPDVQIARNRVQDAQRVQDRDAANALRDKGEIELRWMVQQKEPDERARHRTQALEFLRQALRADGTNVESYYLMAQALTDAGERQQALEKLERGLAYDPEHLASLFAAARLYYIRGRSNDATEAADRFLKLARQHVNSDQLTDKIKAMEELLRIIKT